MKKQYVKRSVNVLDLEQVLLFIINLIESLKVLRLKVGIPVENRVNRQGARVTLNVKQRS